MGPKELVFLKSVLRDGRRGDIQDVRRLSPRQSLRIARAFVGWKGIADEALIGGTEEPETAEGMSVVEGDEEVAIEDIEVEDDEDEEDNDLLGEVEDEEDDVAGIIDPGIAKDEA